MARDIAQWRRQIGSLEPVTVTVQSAAETAMLKQGLAERLGICANFEFLPLRQVLQKIIHQSAPGVYLAGSKEISLGILERLHHPIGFDDPDFGPLQAYLNAEPAIEDRKLQLALALGPLFEQYVLHRPEWVQGWAKGEFSQLEAEDRWQAALFRELVTNNGPLCPMPTDTEHHRRSWLMLDAIHFLNQGNSQTLFIYNVPLRSPVMVEALRRVSHSSSIHLYSINPCLEYWDDVSLRNSTLPLDELSWYQDDPLALQLWGRPGRECLHRALELSEWNVDSDAGPSTPPDQPLAVLNAFHADIRFRTVVDHSTHGDERVEDSIHLVEAPNIRRECEAIASAIWQLAETHADLQWNDCVVALSGRDAEHYRSHLASAFADAYDLPFRALDVPLSSQSRIVDIIRLLLALPTSNYARSDLLRVLTHPTITTRFELGDTSDWVAWCDRLAIFDGADQEDHQQTYITKDLFNWNQGLRRLALGVALHTEADQLDPIFLGETPFVPADIPVRDLFRVGRMLALVRSLIADARALAEAQYTVPEWINYLRIVIDTYVGPVDENDERDLYRVQSAMSGLTIQASGGVSVPFTTARGLILDQLEHIYIHTGPPLAEAVVVGPLESVASLPFRFTFIPGLGEGQFPATEHPSSLDLRKDHRHLGETTPKMRDEYNFLLRVLASSEGIYLSYVSQNPETGDMRLPSSTLSEFLSIIENSYVGPGNLSPQVLPLRRHVAPGYSRAGRSEKRAADLRNRLTAALPPRTSMPSVEDIARFLPEELATRWRKRLALHVPRPGPLAARETRISIANIQRFIEEPVQGWARQVLELNAYDDEQEVLGPTTEPFELDRFYSLRLLEEIFVHWVNDGETLPTLHRRYLETVDRLEFTGQMPTGVFGTTTRHQHQTILETWTNKFLAATEGKSVRLERLAIGRSPRTTESSLTLPPIELPGLLLMGSTHYTSAHGGTFSFTERALDNDKPGQLRLALGSWLTQLSWVASGKTLRGSWRGCIIDRGPNHLAFTLAHISEDTAKTLLTRLSDELLQHHHPYRLPLRTQVRLYHQQQKGANNAKLQSILHAAACDPFGPLKADRFPTPSLEEAFSVIERRLKPFLVAYEDVSS